MFGLNFRKSIVGAGVLAGSVDSHSHVLYGVDDGIKKVQDSLAVLNLLEQWGVRSLWLTPHIMEDVPNTTEALQSRFAELKAAYAGSISLSLSAEYMLDTLFARRLEDRDLLLHGDDTVLVETSALSGPVDFWETIQHAMSMGYRPILAHPERYRYMSMDDYSRLRKMGVILQLNLPSIIGWYGDTARGKAEMLLMEGYYTMAGSDCHRVKAIGEQYSAKVLNKRVVKGLEKLLH